MMRHIRYMKHDITAHISLSFACSTHGHRHSFPAKYTCVIRDCLSNHQYYEKRYCLMDIHITHVPLQHALVAK